MVVLDDDPNIARIIERVVKIPVRAFDTAESLLSKASQLRPMAAFVDIHLSAITSGLDLLPHLRSQWPLCPLIVITTDESSSAINKALGMGADDFVRKPIQPFEIRARLQTRIIDCARHKGLTRLRAGNIVLDLRHRCLRSRGKQAYLSPTALNLATHLMQLKNMIVDRQTLKSKVWGKFAVSDNALDRKIHELRQALSEVSSEVKIENLYGKGFVFQTSPSGESNNKKYDTQPLRKKTTDSTSVGTSTALLIEDSPLDATLVRELVRQSKTLRSLKIKRSKTLAEGIRELERGHIDIVLLDLNLPDSQDLDTVRAVSRATTLPIVVISRNADDKMGPQCIAVGAEDYIPKSELTAQNLAKAIQLALIRSRRSLAESKRTDNRTLSKGQTETDSDEATLDHPQSPESERLLDTNLLEGIRKMSEGESANLLNELIDLFLEHVPPAMEELRAAIQAGEAKRVRFFAHRLKGFSANLGVESMRNECASLELEAASSNLTQASQRLSVIEQHFELATAELVKNWKSAA